MTSSKVHVLAAGRRGAQLLIADRSQAEGAIAVRAIKRHCPHLEVRPVTSVAEAAATLAHQRVTTVFVGSGLDDQTHWQTIRWFADRVGDAAVIALLESRDQRQRQQALEVGASYICSKPDLLVAQLRHEARMALGASDAPAPLSRSRWEQ